MIYIYLKKILPIFFLIASGGAAASAQEAKTTMDSLEATVWVRKITLNKSTTATLYMQFRNDTLMMRVKRDNGWDKVLYRPFYFFTPGEEDRLWDSIAGDYPVFNCKRMGKRNNGKYFIYQADAAWSSRNLVEFREIVKLTADELHLKTPEAYKECSILTPVYVFKAYPGEFPSGPG